MSKTIYIGGRLESKEKGNVVTGANAILDDTKGKKQNVINKETDDELARLESAKQDNLTFDNAPTENSTNPVTSGGVYTAEKALSDAIEAILLLIPSAATALNKLVDTNTMNSSISTATATFRGTYNAVSDLGLTYQATHAQIEAALDALGLTADNNDFVFVQIPVSDQSQDIAKTERFKFNGTNWLYEYDLNTSGFTAAQWAAINSTITLALVQKLAALPTNAELLQDLGLKQDVLTFDNAPTTDSNNPVKSGGIKNAIDTAVGDEATARDNADTALSGLIGDEKTRAEGVEGGLNTRLGAVEGSVSTIQGVIPSEATSSNKLVDNLSMTTYIGTIIDNMDVTFNVQSTDGHVMLHVTQVDGIITSVHVMTSDIASAADLTLLAGRVTSAEGNITSPTTRMGTAETDIATLRALYNALQQSEPDVIEPTDTWPVANPSGTVIYRVIDRVNTPPEYYSDYMWNGTAFVLMATYNNAIDTTPKKDSANLITSGGVFANIGAFDISEYHKSGSTLATYADLTAALAALPSDFQKGGMSIKFVQSSDNKYVQYFLTKNEWSTSEGDWEKMNLEEEISQLNQKVDGISSVDYTVTKGQQYESDGYLSWNRYSCSEQIPAGTYNFKCPQEFYFSVCKYVSDTEGIIVFSYGNMERENKYIDGPWIISVKKVDGTELSTADIDSINNAGIVTEVIRDSINTMCYKINDLEGRIDPIEDFVDDNKTGNFLCLGDSITFGVGVINNQTPTESENTYPKQMEKILGGKSYNGGVGGSSMTDNGSADFPMVVDALTSGDYTKLNTMLDSLTGVNTLAKTRWLEIESLNIANLDFIAIAFGTNDWTISAGITAVCDALQTGINKLRQAFSGVKLYVFTPTYAYKLGYGLAFDTDNYTYGGLYLDEYCDAIEQKCNELNVPVKNMYYCSNIKSNNALSYYVDGKHRNANGYKLLAKQYAGLIRNN